MADKMFLTIGGTDVSDFLDIQNYEMNAEDVYNTWTDGNWIDHRVIVRQRITGKVKAGFKRAADFAAFTALLESAKQTNGYYSISAYVNNTGAVAAFEAFIDTTDADKWDLVNGRQWQVQTLTIRGR